MCYTPSRDIDICSRQSFSTEASAGQPIHLQQYEGLPRLPLEVDDEYITKRGCFGQPPERVSLMAGFAQTMAIWPVLSDCLVRHRTVKSRGGRESLSLAEQGEAHAWITQAHQKLKRMMAHLPPELKQSNQTFSTDDEEVMGFQMHTANILVSYALVVFALVRCRSPMLCCTLQMLTTFGFLSLVV